MSDLFNPDIPLNRWAATPASVKACVFDTLCELGLFGGKEVWLDEFCKQAQVLRFCRSDYRHKPTHETLGRVLRGRGPGAKQVEVRDYLAACGWRVIEDKGKLRLAQMPAPAGEEE